MIKYSLMLTTVRDFSYLEPIFKESTSEAEIIIIDSNYNDETKQKLSELEHNFSQIIYAPKYMTENKVDEHSYSFYKNDKMRCQNTGLAFCEGEWIYKLDDDTEFCPGFFDMLNENLELCRKNFKNDNFVIRPVKLEGWMGHKKWDELPSLQEYQQRYFKINRKSYFETLDQFVATRESIDKLNGMDERYDVGHGHDDLDMMQRFLTLGHSVVLDKRLKTFQRGHKRKIDPITFAEWIYQVELIEIKNGRYKAYNPFELSEIRKKMLKEKPKYIVKNYPYKYVDKEIFPACYDLKVYENIPQGWYNLNAPYPIDQFFTEHSLNINKKRIIEIKDKYKGQDVFILGNSRSITKEFIDKIRDKISFAANGFAVCRDLWDFEPTYYIVTDAGVFDNHLRNIKPEFTINGEMIINGCEYDILNQSKKAKFILSDQMLKPSLFGKFNREEERKQWLEDNIHIRVLNKEELTPPYMCLTPPTYEDLSFDLMEGTYMCGTIITDLMIPTAVWMGFKNIYLKGCSGGPGKFFDNTEGHFWDKEYQRRIYQDTYALFKRKLDEHNVNIYNLDTPLALDPPDQWTLGKVPDTIEYIKLDEIL